MSVCVYVKIFYNKKKFRVSNCPNDLIYITTPNSQENVNNTVALTFPDIQCLHLMFPEVAWALVSSKSQIQLQIMLNSFYSHDYISISYEYAMSNETKQKYFYFFWNSNWKDIVTAMGKKSLKIKAKIIKKK